MPGNRSIASLFFAVLAGATLLPATAGAQSADAPDPHERLVAIIGSADVQRRANQSVVEGARTQFAQDPDIAYLEGECPGAIDVLARVMTELTDAAVEADSAAYRASMLSILRREMPPEQAAEAATFFASELGQSMLHAATSSMTYQASLASAIGSEDGEVPRSAYEQDRADAVRGVTQQMDAADLYEAGLIIGSSDWGKTMARLRPQFTALQYETFNQPTTPEEDTAMDKAFTEALELHLAACDAGPNSK